MLTELENLCARKNVLLFDFDDTLFYIDPIADTISFNAYLYGIILNKFIIKSQSRIIVTNESRAVVYKAFATYPALNVFDQTWTKDFMTKQKPDPSIFYDKVYSSARYSTEDYVYIGDSWVDQEFAKNCGIDFYNIKERYAVYASEGR